MLVLKLKELNYIKFTNNHKIFSSYEPCIYPGVNSKFYWNKTYKDYEHTGRCLSCTKIL